MMTVFDVETAPNRCMVGFMDLATGKVKQFEHSKGKKIAKYIKGRTLVGFNSNNYDNLIVSGMIKGKTAKELYAISFDLIEGDGKRWDYQDLLKDQTIDLMEVAPGQASLKLYGARLGIKKLQDLPYAPHDKLSKKEWKEVCEYNVNDLRLTEALYVKLKPQLELREKIGKQYGFNAMSKSDAQIAESIFSHELRKSPKELKKGMKLPKSISYVAPKTVKFKSAYLNELVTRIEDTGIEVSKGGSPMMPKWLKDEVIEINGKAYNIGLGGLHSMEKSLAVVGDLGNVDVASYYPSLIIELGLYPKHLGAGFLDIYASIKKRRLDAKASGDMVVSDVLKITLNGSYGKFGSFYSFLYAPDLMLTVTFTGQLYLLMLIEAIENKGIEVLSSNTDGIEVLYKSEKDKKIVRKLVTKWEKRTGMDMEYGLYKATYNRDVNNYIAVYDGYVKSKGFYGEDSLAKNPQHPIVQEAIRKFLLDGTPMKKTIKKCKDPAQFCISRAVTGGALWSAKTYPDTEEYEEYIKRVPFKQNKALEKRNDMYKRDFVLAEGMSNYIGKTVRFYYAVDGKPMFYSKSGNRVPKSDGCKPMMELSDTLFEDVNYEYYYELAETYLKDLGI